MSLSEQQKALQSEPGFNRLPPEGQQRVMNGLARLDSMPPEQRQRTIGQIEAWERLTRRKSSKCASPLKNSATCLRIGKGWLRKRSRSARVPAPTARRNYFQPPVSEPVLGPGAQHSEQRSRG